MGKSHIGDFQAMRCLLICSLLILLANCIRAADVFKNEKVKLGKRTCTCTFTMETKGTRCSGQAKCDKKCTGTGAVDVDPYSFTLAVKKGKGKISKCTVAAMPTVGPVEPTGSDQDPFLLGQDQDPFQQGQEQDLCLLLDQGLVWKIRCQGVLVLAMEDQDQHLRPDQAQDQDQPLQQEQDQDQVNLLLQVKDAC